MVITGSLVVVGGHDSICAVCGPPCLDASCVHLAPNVA